MTPTLFLLPRGSLGVAVEVMEVKGAAVLMVVVVMELVKAAEATVKVAQELLESGRQASRQPRTKSQNRRKGNHHEPDRPCGHREMRS